MLCCCNDRSCESVQCGHGGTICGKKEWINSFYEVKVVQPFEPRLQFWDAFQHLASEITRSDVSQSGFSRRGFTADVASDCVSWTIRLSSVSESLGPILWSSILKLFLLPGLVGIGCWWLDLERERMMIVLVFCSLPASASAYVMAHQMGGDAELMASILAILKLISIFLYPCAKYRTLCELSQVI